MAKPFFEAGIQESLADLEVGSSGPTHPVKVERVKYLTREIQVSGFGKCRE